MDENEKGFFGVRPDARGICFLTACNDEEYVDEPIYDESVSESGGYIEDAGSESDKYIEDNEPVKIEESVDSAEDFGTVP